MPTMRAWPARAARRIGALSNSNWLYLALYTLVFAIGTALVQSESELLSAVGASLVATGVAGWVLFLWVILNEGRSKRAELVSNLGLVDAFPARASQIKNEYDTRLAHANEAIDVLGFGLRHLRQDYEADFEKWAASARVRILLLNPEAPTKNKSFAKQRDLEEGNSPTTISDDVKQFLQATESLWSDPSSGFAVRLYSALPSVNIFRVDNELFWGPYLIGKQSRNTPTLVVRRGGTLFDSFADHFDALWNNDQLTTAPQASD